MVVSNIFFFTPIWGNDPIWRTYFSDGLKPPTRDFFRQVGLNASEQKLESLAASEGSQFHRSGGLRSRLAAADGRDAELMEFFSPGLEAKKDEYKMGYDRIYDDI